MKVLQTISRALDRICGAAIVAAVGAMVIITSAQIVCRIWFTALSWSEEVTRFLLIWATFLGATCVYRHGGNIAITALVNLLPEKIRRALTVVVHIVCMALFAALLFYGARYCGKQVRTAAAVPIQMKYVYLCLPISMGIMMYHAFVMILETITGKEANAA